MIKDYPSSSLSRDAVYCSFSPIVCSHFFVLGRLLPWSCSAAPSTLFNRPTLATSFKDSYNLSRLLQSKDPQSSKMATIVEDLMKECYKLLADYVKEEATTVLGVKDELQKLLRWMSTVQRLFQDAESSRFDQSDSSTRTWLSQLKYVLYDAEDIIDLCRIEGAQLLADQNLKSKTSPVYCNFSSPFSYFTCVPLRRKIGNRIKELNGRLDQIYKERQHLKLEKSPIPETSRITLVDLRQTSSMVDPLAVGKEVEDAANRLVNRLVSEKVEEKCRLLAVVGMGGIGKTTLAQMVFNHKNIKESFNLKVWVCVSQKYSEIELLQLIIRKANGSYGNANTKAELLPVLSHFISGQSLFLVLDDVWRADVWVDLLRAPLYHANMTLRVLITTRYENVAKGMDASLPIHHVEPLSTESGWDMLRRLVFPNGEEKQAHELKNLGFKIVENCGHLPLLIKAIAGVLKDEGTRKAWQDVCKSEVWSNTNLKEFRDALYLHFEDLPSHLKQCFLYFSLYGENALLYREKLTSLWVAEGFITEKQHSLMEGSAEKYFDELVKRNLLQPQSFKNKAAWSICKMHGFIRSFALFLSEGETSCGDENVKSSTASIKLHSISVENKAAAAEILDSVAEQGALRTLLASGSDLLLNDKRLRRLLRLRVLDISSTKIELLPDSIGNLLHLRYLDLSFTNITAIPESIKQLSCLQFLNIQYCKKLTELPIAITLLHNLRYLNIWKTPLVLIPKGIGELLQLNHLNGFVVINRDDSCKLEELRNLKQMRTLNICNLEKAQSGANILRDLLSLSDLELYFSKPNDGLTVEEIFDELKPPQSLEKLKIDGFFGSRFPNWMAMASFERYVPYLTILEFKNITSCTQLPPLGQLPELKLLTIQCVSKVEEIGSEFLGCHVNSSTRIAFPKLQELYIESMPKLKKWSFGNENASSTHELMPCLHKLSIDSCPLLNQLPKYPTRSAIKVLHINATSLKLLVDLPPTIEELKISNNETLENVCDLPDLKFLNIKYCEALSGVGKINSLQQLTLHFRQYESLPRWILMLLLQRRPQNDSNERFLLKLKCPTEVLRECIKGGYHWAIIEHIPEVIADGLRGGRLLHYIKQPYFYNKCFL